MIEPPPRYPARRDRAAGLLSALVVAVSVGALGVLLGFVWHLAAPTLPLKKVEGGLAYVTPDPEQQIAQDGWFALLGLGFGLVAAVVVWAVARRHRGPVQLVALTLGAVAAGFVAWQVGKSIDADRYREQVAAAPLETVIERPADLYATQTKTCLLGRCVTTRGGDLLVPGLGAVIGYSLLAGWSRWPSLRREEDEAETQAQQARLQAELEAQLHAEAHPEPQAGTHPADGERRETGPWLSSDPAPDPADPASREPRGPA